MSEQKKAYYTNSYLLSSLVINQQHIPKKYNTHDYFGGCMRIQEQQTASFLYDFINNIAIVLPRDYELLQNLLFIAHNSRYSKIKKLLPLAMKKYDVLSRTLNERQVAADMVKFTGPDEHKTSKYSILDNKKKMLSMSCTDLCLLGDAITTERDFNTTKIKNKFASFVSYRIELVLRGKMPIDPDFDILLKKYGTEHQNNLYEKIISNRIASYTPVQIQPVKRLQKKSAPKTKSKPKIVAQPKQQEVKKSGTGFFNKIKKSVSGVIEKTKKLSLIGGIFALSIFGGKKVMDSIDVDNNYNQSTVKTEYTTINEPRHIVIDEPKQSAVRDIRHQTQNTARTTNAIKQSGNVINRDTITNPVLIKSVKRLQLLKDTNPADRNMDVNATAQKLYQRFGADAYNVILTCATAPYKLNDMTGFDIKPTTHNMIEYLCNNNLSNLQRANLETFVVSHIALLKNNMQNKIQHQR